MKEFTEIIKNITDLLVQNHSEKRWLWMFELFSALAEYCKHMNWVTEKEQNESKEVAEFSDVTKLSDGSAFFTASFPDHYTEEAKAEQSIEEFYRRKVEELSAIKLGFPKIIRYDLVNINLGPSGTMSQMESDQNGEWVHFDDVRRLLGLDDGS